MKPKITVITVVYNGADTIKETIESVINQTYANIEYIIIDGSSTDGSRELIEGYNAHLTQFISEPDEGIYDAMNKGIDLATGEWLLFLNSGDTLFNSNTLELVFQREIATKSIIYGAVSLNSSHKVLRPMRFTKFNLIIWGTRVLCHQSIIVRRDIVSHYNTKYELKGELDWYFKLLDSTNKSEREIMHEPICTYQLGGIGEQRIYRNVWEHICVLYSHVSFFLVMSIPVLIFKIITTKYAGR